MYDDLLQGSPETLLSVGETCYRHGCGYCTHTQDPGNAAARLWHPDYGRDTDVELVKDGVLFRLPEMSADVPWISGERKTAIASLTGAIATAMSALPSWYREHAEHGHPFRPDCDHCMRGRLRERQAFRKQVGEGSVERGYTA